MTCGHRQLRRPRRIGMIFCAALIAAAAGTLLAQTSASKKPVKAYAPAKTPWGDPDIAGVYTNNDESLIPFERPASLDGKRLEEVTEAELDRLRDDRTEDRIEAD